MSVPRGTPDIPAEMTTYEVRCAECERAKRGNGSLLLSGPHRSGSLEDSAALERALRLAQGHAQIAIRHRAVALMNKTSIVIESYYYADETEGVRS